jgi:hypothetical protein
MPNEKTIAQFKALQNLQVVANALNPEAVIVVMLRRQGGDPLLVEVEAEAGAAAVRYTLARMLAGYGATHAGSAGWASIVFQPRAGRVVDRSFDPIRLASQAAGWFSTAFLRASKEDGERFGSFQASIFELPAGPEPLVEYLGLQRHRTIESRLTKTVGAGREWDEVPPAQRYGQYFVRRPRAEGWSWSLMTW